MTNGKAIAILATVMLLGCANVDAATDSFISGAQAQLSESPDRGDHQKAYNIGYYQGSVTSTVALENKEFCHPSEWIKLGQAFKVVALYTRNHPERHHIGDIALTLEALKDAFPCHK